MDWQNAIQWPAMAATVLASWLVGSRCEDRRAAGFWVFLVSNVLWVIWGWHASAWALITLQVALVVLNVRGLRRIGVP